MLVQCSISNCLIFIPFIFPIFIQIHYIVKNMYIKEDNDNKVFYIFRYYLSYTLSIIFLIIIKCKIRTRRRTLNKKLLFKRKNTKNSIWINPLNIKQKELIRGKKIKSFLFIILLSLISFISILFHQLCKDDNTEKSKQSLGIFFEVIFFILLSILFLNDKLYKHHYFSLGIITFILLIYIIIFIIISEDEVIIKSIWYYFIYSFLYCLYDVLGKKYMLLYFNSPYNSMLNIGLILCISLALYEIISYFYREDYIGIIKGFQEIDYSYFFLFPVDIILEFLWNVGIWLTIYFFTPCHFIISESISEMIYYIIDTINRFEVLKIQKIHFILIIIFYSVTSFIIILASLIFNEIIILNCFGLSKYTKKRIQERERLDTYFADIILEENKNMNKTNKGDNDNNFHILDRESLLIIERDEEVVDDNINKD